MIISRRHLFKLIAAAAVVGAVPSAVLVRPSTWRKHFEKRMNSVALIGPGATQASIESFACIAASKQLLEALRDEDRDILGRVRRYPDRNIHQLEMLESREKLQALDDAIVALVEDYQKTPFIFTYPDGMLELLDNSPHSKWAV